MKKEKEDIWRTWKREMGKRKKVSFEKGKRMGEDGKITRKKKRSCRT